MASTNSAFFFSGADLFRVETSGAFVPASADIPVDDGEFDDLKPARKVSDWVLIDHAPASVPADDVGYKTIAQHLLEMNISRFGNQRQFRAFPIKWISTVASKLFVTLISHGKQVLMQLGEGHVKETVLLGGSRFEFRSLPDFASQSPIASSPKQNELNIGVGF